MILELYAKGGIRYKEYKNFLKKLEKKGRLKRSETIHTGFERMNVDPNEDNTIHILNAESTA